MVTKSKIGVPYFANIKYKLIELLNNWDVGIIFKSFNNWDIVKIIKDTISNFDKKKQCNL